MHTIYRRLQDAKTTYAKVLEIDPRHSVALGFLGMVYHLLEDVDRAIIKYHEVLILIIHLCSRLDPLFRRSALIQSIHIRQSYSILLSSQAQACMRMHHIRSLAVNRHFMPP
jgi:hypothetical protein